MSAKAKRIYFTFFCCAWACAVYLFYYGKSKRKLQFLDAIASLKEGSRCKSGMVFTCESMSRNGPVGCIITFKIYIHILGVKKALESKQQSHLLLTVNVLFISFLMFYRIYFRFNCTKFQNGNFQKYMLKHNINTWHLIKLSSHVETIWSCCITRNSL